jgi:hypothetical protein
VASASAPSCPRVRCSVQGPVIGCTPHGSDMLRLQAAPFGRNRLTEEHSRNALLSHSADPATRGVC